MSALNDCCSPCVVTPPVNIPGPPGSDGTNSNSFSIVANNFNLPAVGANVNATFDNCAWMAVGQNVFAVGPANFQVVSVTGTTGATLKFLGYLGDQPPGFIVVAGTKASPAGIQGVAPNGFGLINITYINTGQTVFTPVSTAKSLLVECIGGGGCGGGGGSTAADASCGSGGGGGAYSTFLITANVQQTFVTAVGLGGSPGAAGNNPGGDGGDTIFKDAGLVVLCLAKGGKGGLGGGAPATTALFVAGGAGGPGLVGGGGVGDVMFDGNAGGASHRVSGTVGISGYGGAGPWGGGAPAVVAQGNGVQGAGFGGGGSGGNTLNGGAATSGISGGPGIIRVWQFG